MRVSLRWHDDRCLRSRGRPAHFFDVPYPFDLRLDANRHPILDGFPNPKSVAIVDGLRVAASEAKGFPVVPVVYLRTSAPLAPMRADELIVAKSDAPILLVDIDESSPRRGELTPLIAKTLTADAYVPENGLAVAPRPGFVLRPNTRYAVVVTTRVHDAEARPLAPSELLTRFAKNDPSGEKESLAGLTFAPLWQVLEEKASRRNKSRTRRFSKPATSWPISSRSPKRSSKSTTFRSRTFRSSRIRR